MMDARISWTVAHRMLETRLNELIRQLETVTPDRLDNLQGQIAGLRYAIGIPEEIAREAERRGSIPTGQTPVY